MLTHSNASWIRLGGAAAILGGLAQITYLVLATAIYFYPDWHDLFLTYLYGWQIGPPLAALFVLALAALYARYVAAAARAPAATSRAERGLAAVGVALGAAGLALSALAFTSYAWALGMSRTCVRVTDCNSYDPAHLGMLYAVLYIVGNLLAVVGLSLFWIAVRRASALRWKVWLLSLAGVAALLSPLAMIGAYTLHLDGTWEETIALQVVTAALGIVWALCWMLIGSGLLFARHASPPRTQLAVAP